MPISKLTNSFSSTVKACQHNKEKEVKFHFSLKDIFLSNPFVTLREVELEFTPIIQSEENGFIDIYIKDSRKCIFPNYNVFGVRIFPHIYQSITVGGFDWCDNRQVSPYSIVWKSEVYGYKPGVSIGRLKVTPRFQYQRDHPILADHWCHITSIQGKHLNIREIENGSEGESDCSTLQAVKRYRVSENICPLALI